MYTVVIIKCVFSEKRKISFYSKNQTSHTLRPRAYAPTRAPRARARAPQISRGARN